MADEQEAEVRFRADVAEETHAVERDARDMRSDRITAKLLDMVDHLQRDVVDHMVRERATVNELKEGLARVEKRVEEFVSAFPSGDAVKHRLAHETQMREEKKKEQFWEKMKFTFWALVLTGVTVWIVIVLWKAFLLGPK